MVKIIPKEKETKEKKSPIIILFFWFSILFFFLSAGLFFIFDWQVKKTESSLQRIEDELKRVGTPQQKSLEEAIYDYKRKIDDVPILLKGHKTPTKILDLLEEKVHPGVWFTSFQFISNKNQVVLKGEAQNLLSLAQQISIFEEAPQVKELNISSVGMGPEGNIIFDLILNLVPTFLLIK
jgi:type II secretory pathway component PulL